MQLPGNSQCLQCGEVYPYVAFDCPVCKGPCLVLNSKPQDAATIGSDEFGYIEEASRKAGEVVDGTILYIRAIVLRIEKPYIYVRRIVGGHIAEELKVNYVESSAQSGNHYADLEKVVSVGSWVCLVTPLDRGVYWVASEIVLEPDYLLSPQELGRASVYKCGAVWFWLARLDRPKAKQRQYIARGNVASLYLSAHMVDDAVDDKALLVKYFKNDPLGMAALCDVAGGMSALWKNDVIDAGKNLKRIVRDDLPAQYGVRPDEWQVEAPLITPVHGLSARADAIRYSPDGKQATILELKSGKWNHFNGDFPKDEHLFQPYFYGETLYYSHGIHRADVRTLLCYSPTIDGIAGNVFPVKVWKSEIQRCSRFRDGVVKVAGMIRDGSFAGLVGRLKTVFFKNDRWGDKLWAMMAPEVEHKLSVLRGAEPLALAYFYRFMAFLAEEEYSPRTVVSSEDGDYYVKQPSWSLDLCERQKSGLVYIELSIVGSPRVDSFGRVMGLILSTSASEGNSCCNIRVGDSVYLYRMEAENSNVTNSILFVAVVEDIAADTISLTFADPYPLAMLGDVSAERYVVEGRVGGAGSALYKGLFDFLNGNSRRRDLILNKVAPRWDDTKILSDRFLSEHQGVSSIIQRIWSARDWFLVWGPPGTGKTHTMMNAIVDAVMQESNDSILLVSYTNRAVDEICDMLEDRMRQHPDDDYWRIGSTSKCSVKYKGHLPESRGFESVQEVKDSFQKVRIFVGTTSSLAPDHPIFTMSGKRFAVAVVDEASQLLEPHVLPLFCAKESTGAPVIDKFVFIGDDRQLPAVVQQQPEISEIHDETLRNIGLRNCRDSFFERLKRIAANDEHLIGMLNRQWRMHPDIADFCRLNFYESLLENGSAPHQLEGGLRVDSSVSNEFQKFISTTRFGFLAVDSEDVKMSSKANVKESIVCGNIVAVLVKCMGRNPTDIGIIVPFRNQIASIRRAIYGHIGERAGSVLIDTVERFQGSQRKVILFSTVVTSPRHAPMISDALLGSDNLDRKLNVAITRSKEQFFLVGHPNALSALTYYAKVIAWMKSKCAYYKVR